jgi:nucleotide-binding universal stress UspA family protein
MSKEGAMGRIVVGVDGSESSKDALRWAERQARLTDSELQVVSAWDFVLPQSMALSTFDTADPIENQRRGLRAIVEEVVGEGPTVRLRLEVVESRPVHALLELAAGADLLVVGCRGHGEFAGMLLGSVSLHCAVHAPCPVVVVRHHATEVGSASTVAAGSEVGS